jgi:transcriptional regulator with GAF, ATPase, and Fis domain
LPRVVEVLARRYVELEHLATAGGTTAKAKLSTDLKIERGEAPAAGFQSAASAAGTSRDLVNFRNSIAGAEDRTRTLKDLAHAVDSCEDEDALFHTLRTGLRKLVPYDVMVLYRRQGEYLAAAAVDGDDYRLFASLEIPLGMGLSGWVAENRKAILNGNPSVEPGYLNDPTKFSTLRSALAVPLESEDHVIGVLSLYRMERDAFGPEHLNSLLSLGARLARALNLTAGRFEAQLGRV